MKANINKRKNLIKIYLFLFLIIPVLFILFFSNLNLILNFIDLNGEKIELEEKIKMKDKIILETENNLEKIDSESGQDKIIIEKFSRYKPGEKVIEILE